MSSQNLGRPVQYAPEHGFELGIAESLRPVTPDEYVNKALLGLIRLVEVTTANDGTVGPVDAEAEDVALAEFGMPSVTAALTEIEANHALLTQVTSAMTTRVVSPRILLPQGKRRATQSPQSQSGDNIAGRHKDTSKQYRREAILCMLAKDFNIDITNPDAVHIESGKLPEQKYRKTSYTSIVVPELSRVIFVCNQKTQATFVLDTDRAQEIGETAESLGELSKDQLYEYIENHSKLGQAIFFNDAYFDTIARSLRDIPEKQPVTSSIAVKPESVSLRGLQDVLHIGPGRVDQVLLQAAESGILDQAHLNQARPQFTPDQINKLGNIRDELFGQRIEDAPDYCTVTELADKLGTSAQNIERSMTQLFPDVEWPSFSRVGKTVRGLHLQIQGAIEQDLTTRQIITSSDERPTFHSIAKELSLGRATVEAAHQKMTGIPKPAGNGRHVYLTGKQKTELVDYMKAEEIFLPQAPQGTVSRKDACATIKCSPKTFNTLVETAGELLGETPRYRFGSARATGYTADQIALLKSLYDQSK
jgi:hypothetical protein